MRQILMRALAALAISLGFIAVVWSGLFSTVRAANQPPVNPSNAAPLISVLYRFDPTTQKFLTVPLPLGSLPLGVVVTGSNPTQIWVAEFGRNQVGRVIFTSTTAYQYVEYPVTSTVTSTVASQPFRIDVHGNDVWFTERGANRVGRLDAATGQIVEFYGHGLAPNAGLANVQVAPDGAVWLTGQQSNQLIRLTVNSPSDYAFQPYTHSLLIQPFGLAIQDADTIWVTALATRKVGRLQASKNVFVWPTIPFTTFTFIEPYEIVFQGGSSWTTDPGNNRFQQVGFDTYPWQYAFGPIDRPVGVAARNSNVFWITQQNAWGAVARFVYTTTTSFLFNSFPLPASGLLPAGVAVAEDNTVWLAAYKPNRLYLPIVLRNTP